MPAMNRDPEKIEPGLREKIRRLVAGELPWPLFMFGPAGVGKTCASLCLIDRCYKKDYDKEVKKKSMNGNVYIDKVWCRDGPGGVYRTSQEIFDVLFSEFGKKGRERTEATIKEWGLARLAVLDELGSREKVGDFAYNTTKQLLDLRSGKPLIVISNLDLPTLATLYDDRITSRLASGTVLKVEGEDRRVVNHPN